MDCRRKRVNDEAAKRVNDDAAGRSRPAAFPNAAGSNPERRLVPIPDIDRSNPSTTGIHARTPPASLQGKPLLYPRIP